MIIQINDKYRIETDSMNYILQEKGIKGKDSKNPGSEYWKNICYPTNLKQARKRCLDYEIMTSDLKDVDKIIDCLERLYEGLNSRRD